MDSDYIWRDFGVTDEEARGLIKYHVDAARRLSAQAKKHNDRALEIERSITMTTVIPSGART